MSKFNYMERFLRNWHRQHAEYMANIGLIQHAMANGITFYIQRGKTVYKILTLNDDGGATTQSDEEGTVTTWLSHRETVFLSELAQEYR